MHFNGLIFRLGHAVANPCGSYGCCACMRICKSRCACKNLDENQPHTEEKGVLKRQQFISYSSISMLNNSMFLFELILSVLPVKTPASLSKHMLTNSGEKPKPHECPECKNTFGHAGVLTRHMFIHSGEKPYKCTMCDKSFN